MNLPEEEAGYGDKEEEEDDEEQVTTSKLLFPSQYSSSSSSNKFSHHNHPWLQQDSHNFDKMDLSLATTTTTTNTEIDQNYSPSAAGSSSSVEKEHMFDKVVTPSDVGKLNRLVIPKQHAEKYFPLDSSSNEKGLLLNFEDRNGKPWRFRYSYWNSSQSYVMTKGWSRFVKEKKLDAGDIVSFQRGIGESGKNRLFIDWRRRPNVVPDPSSFSHLDHHHIQNPIHFPPRWTGRLYPLPQPQFPQQLHFNSSNTNFLHHHHHANQYHHYNSTRHYYLPPPQPQPPLPQPPLHHLQQGDHHHHHHLPMVLDSVPVVHGKTVGKRLRLFGVNMECPTEDEDNESPNSASSNSAHQLTMQAEFSKKGKSTNSSSSLSVDLDL